MFSIVFLIIIAIIALLSKLIVLLTKGVCKSSKCLVGKCAIVTGGNSGMGYEIVLNLASRGCKVIIADVVNADVSRKQIIELSNNENVFYKHLDLASLKSVRKFASEIVQDEEKVDILINNAGSAGFNNQFTEDGLLKVMQINYFGHFLLTHLLLGLLKAAQNSRVVFVSSCMAFTHDLLSSSANNINVAPNYKNKVIQSCAEYSNSKICTLIASNIFAKKLERYGILCTSLHPGAVFTPIFRTALHLWEPELYVSILKNILFFFLYFLGKTPREGAQVALHCALSDDIKKKNGEYFWDCVPFFKPKICKDEKFCQQMWEESEKFVKLSSDEKIL